MSPWNWILSGCFLLNRIVTTLLSVCLVKHSVGEYMEFEYGNLNIKCRVVHQRSRLNELLEICKSAWTSGWEVKPWHLGTRNWCGWVTDFCTGEMSIVLKHWEYRSPSSEGCLLVRFAALTAGGISRNKNNEQNQTATPSPDLSGCAACVVSVW